MSEARIILADDHEILRAGLRSLIAQEPSLKIVAEAKDGEELLERMKTQRCDLVVMDISMPNLDGISALKVLNVRYPKVKVLILTMQKDREHFKSAMTHGASAYVLKDDAFDQLILAIKIVLKGKKFISPAISSILTDQYVRSLDHDDIPSIELLTKRELEILKLIAQGLPNKNIAMNLKLSPRTVETHRANLSRKLGLTNTANLVRYAISKGLI